LDYVGSLAIPRAFQTSACRFINHCPSQNFTFRMPMAPLIAKSLEDYRIQGLPSSAFYVSEFISKAEEQVLLDKVT
jgi:hypothetical protein